MKWDNPLTSMDVFAPLSLHAQTQAHIQPILTVKLLEILGNICSFLETVLLRLLHYLVDNSFNLRGANTDLETILEEQ